MFQKQLGYNYNMRVYNGKSIKFKDGLAGKRRRVFIFKILFFACLSVTLVGLILYLLFFSGLLEINQVKVNGLDKVSRDEFNNGLNDRLNSKWLGLLERQRNVFFFNSDAFKTDVLATFPEIKNIFINKEPPHILNVDITERATAGIWCFVNDLTRLNDSGQAEFITSCKYFDGEGAFWGEATRSSGFLILVVDDLRLNPVININLERSRENSQHTPALSGIDQALLDSIMRISDKLAKMNIFVSKFTIPNNFIGDFTAFISSGYELMFSIDSDIEGQLEVLRIFLADKRDMSAQSDDPDFKLEYIDLRINGRIYYK